VAASPRRRVRRSDSIKPSAASARALSAWRGLVRVRVRVRVRVGVRVRVSGLEKERAKAA
jgi:hypothetical protein